MYNNYVSVDDRKASTENANESQEILDKHKPSLQRKQFRMEEPGWNMEDSNQVYNAEKMAKIQEKSLLHNNNFGLCDTSIRTLFPGTTFLPLSIVPPQSEKLVKMRNRKMKKQAKENDRNGKQVVIIQKRTDEYNIENILAELGETESNKKSNSSNSKSKKPKAERKRSGKLSSSIGKNKDSKELDKEEDNISTAGGEEEDDEEIFDKSQSGVNVQDHISSTSQTISSDLAPQSAMLNRQTSRSTEDMFTPVIKKHSKWKNKKACMLSKDDSGHTCSSSSSASSTTSSTALQSASYASHSSALSTKPKYNLRRKSALRPSQSFDTMKSASSSVASDDTLEAVTSSVYATTPSSSAASIAAKDHLDLAADFPPLSASEASREASNGEIRSDQIVPKWVTKNSTPQAVVSQASQPSAASKASTGSAAPSEKVLSHQNSTETNTEQTNAEKTSDQQKNNPNSSSSSSFSPSAVIDASDVNMKPPEHSELTLPPPPPPDVTVVPLPTNISQQCTANAVMLPDIAAQAPNVMNTTNSSSGVSSNAGDLTPPQTINVSEPPSFYQLEESDIISSNKAVVICETGNNVDYPEMKLSPETDESATASNCVEFGWEVNVLDLIYRQNQQHLASEDEAIVSFGNTIVLTENNCSEIERSVSGHGIPQDQLAADENYNNCQNQVQTCCDMNEQVLDDPTAVKTIIPNYDQILQYVAKSWNDVEQELQDGSAQQY